MGRMTKRRRGKHYIDDAGWGPEAGSIEYGYRVPFGRIHVFIGKIGEPGPEPDIYPDIIETAQRARPARVQPVVKCAFVGFIHGAESENISVSGDEMVVYSDGESSTGETESLYQLQDSRLGGCSDGDIIMNPFEPPNRVAIFMAGTQTVQHTSTAAEMISGSAATTAAGAGGPVRPPAQIVTDLLDSLTALLTAMVNPTDQDKHNAAVAKLRDEIAQAKEELNAENTRMAEERGALDAQAQRSQSESFRLMLDQDASNEVMRKRHQTHLPPVYEARNLLNTPGAGPSNPLAGNRVETPGTGAQAQPLTTDPPRQDDIPPQDVLTPSGHYSNPLDNMIAVASRLAAIRLMASLQQQYRRRG